MTREAKHECIYLDHHATTPLDPAVLEEMLPCLREHFGNASSNHHPYGRKAHELVETSREQVAGLLGAESDEIIFTGSATESNNIALKGLAEVYREKGDHIITQVTEHKSVLETCKYLEKKQFRVTYLPVDTFGQIALADLENAMTEKTIAVSIMAANNEIGTLQPLEAIGKLTRKKQIFFHVDAAQAVGKIECDVEKNHIDLLSASAHKLYGPKGVGILYRRKKSPRVRVGGLFQGGGQEDGLRPGTLNVAGIVGMGKAFEIASKVMKKEGPRIGKLRDKLEKGLKAGLEDVHVNGHPSQRLSGNLNMSFGGIDGESLLKELNEDLAVSSGSACVQQSTEPSYVLKALNISGERVHTSIRFGLGRFNQESEIDYAIERMVKAVHRLRAESPMNGAVRQSS